MFVRKVVVLSAIDDGHHHDASGVHTSDSNRVDRFAARLLAGELTENPRCVIADVSSGGRMYGRARTTSVESGSSTRASRPKLHSLATELATAEEVDTLLGRIADRAGVAIVVAMYPHGSAATEVDHRLLRAYARHAAAAFDSVASLERARRDRDTAEAMLVLAKGLAEADTRSAVASRLAEAVPGVAACDGVRVWLWDTEADCRVLEARHPGGDHTGSVDREVIRLTDMAQLANLIANPAAAVVDAERAEPAVKELMDADGVTRSAIVPITVRGTFLGVLAAEFTSNDRDAAADANDELLARLTGLADQAATAIDNADLLARVRQEALHDSLTGLPNRRLMERRANHALQFTSSPRLSLLFVDIDRFKRVNDTLGHEVGVPRSGCGTVFEPRTRSRGLVATSSL